LQPSKELAVIVGSNPLPRGEVVSKMWEYIKKHNLQNPENKREIIADDKLQPIFGKPKVTMFEMNKHLAQHLNEVRRGGGNREKTGKISYLNFPPPYFPINGRFRDMHCAPLP